MKGRMAGETLNLTHRIAAWLIRRRWTLLALSLVLTVAGVWPSSQLRFDVMITNLFPPDDPVLLAYQDGLKLFGGAELVVVAYTDPDLLTADGLMRLHQFSESFRDLKPLGLERVESLADVRWPLAPLDPTPLFAQIAKHGRSREELKTELLKSELYRNVFLGDDGRTTAISITIRPEHTDLERRRLIAGIRERAQRDRFETVVGGGPILTHDAVVFVDQDSRRLGWVSTLALLIVIGILFRKVRWVVLPLAVVHVTLVWTKALLWLVEAHLSMVSTTLTALVTVIGVAGIVQVTARYREERERADVGDALLTTMSAAGPAVFWASLTTAAGFGSLFVSSIMPVRNFAVMLSLASALVFVVTAALVPGVVTFGKRPSDPGAAPGERYIERLLEATMDWSLARPWQVAVVVVALLVLTVAGIFRIRVETDFTHNFRRSSDVVVAYHFIEDRLDGVGTMDLEFSAPDGLTPELADRLRNLETRLRQTPNLTKALGLIDVVDFFDVGITGALSRSMGPKASLAAKLWVLNQQRPDLVPTFWNEKEKQMRVMLRAREQSSSAVKNDLIAAVERIGHEVLDQPNAPAGVRVTGTYPLLNHLVSSLMSDQLNTLLVATAAVFSIMCIALRSVRLAVVGLVPKIGPILMVFGAMGWLGVPIDMGTPMIASVSVGISVGFSIHYLYRFRQERLAGVPFDQALRATHRRVGGAMVFSNLALVVGFAALVLSNFIPTIHFSILADVALIGGLAGNLLVLPLLLKLISS
ncbi:MAG: efflux RND transporter permease subunit [Thermoguttaceae bacterium]